MPRRAGPPLPDDFAQTIWHMHHHKDPRLNTVLALAHHSGWTLRALGDATGITREGIYRRTTNAYHYPPDQLPDIPEPPQPVVHWKQPPPPKPAIPDGVADRLRELQQLATGVNGYTPLNSPARQASVELAALIHDLAGQGIPKTRIAEIIGVTPSAVSVRLSRHGYRPRPPSMERRVDQKYRGIAMPPAECGTYSGYRRHRRRHEPVCGACAHAMSDYNRRRYAARKAEQ